MPNGFTATLDTRQQDAFLKRYTPSKLREVLDTAAAEGGKAGAKVLRAAAPVGVSKRQGQYYRRNGLGHGAFRSSVTSRKIRGRSGAINIQGSTVGVVIGPIGKKAFTRGWIEGGTSGPGRHRQRANPWVERTAGPAFLVAQRASEAMLETYARMPV